MIRTDQRSFVHLSDHRGATPSQQKAFLAARVSVSHHLQIELTNAAADALSRREQEEQLHSVIVVQLRWLETVVEGYEKDPEAQKMLQELSLHNPNDEGNTLARGVIHHQIKTWLGSHREAHDAVLHALHNSAIGGHFGVEATFQRVCSLFSWSRMRQDVHRFVQTCQILQQEIGE